MYITEEQTKQWPKDKVQRTNNYLQEEFEDTKGEIRGRKSKRNRQHNGQKIPKGQSGAVNRRRTDNTMDKQLCTRRV